MEKHKDHTAKEVTRREERVNRIRPLTQNFFLHIHASRVHPHSLKPGYTFGLGIILGFLFLIMIMTGVLLMLNYVPTVENAYNSVKDIIYVVPGGRIIRNIHKLASYGMVIVVFLHLLRVFYTGAYLGNRKKNWVIGVVMFIVVLLMSFSGYLLPWDQLSFWAVTIGSNIAASARELTDLLDITSWLDIGGALKRLLIGADSVGQAALTRFYMLHVVVLPISLLVLIGVHFWRIRKDGGLSRPTDISDSKEKENIKLYSWPIVMWAELAVFTGLITLLLFLAFFIDAPLLEQANPAHPENPAKSPWYFLGIQELVSYSAFSGGVLVPLLFVFFLFSIPYKDREDRYLGRWFSNDQGRRITLCSAAVSAVIVILQVFVHVSFGWLRDWFPGISHWLPMLINPATITVLFFILLAAYVRRRTGSTRMSAIALFTASMMALVIFTVIGIWFRGANWEFIVGG